jgi:predicted transcriptional regulator
MPSAETSDATNMPTVEPEMVKAVFEREASISWQHYKKTGLHLTGDEVLAWLETWGIDEEADPPQSHV